MDPSPVMHDRLVWRRYRRGEGNFVDVLKETKPVLRAINRRNWNVTTGRKLHDFCGRAETATDCHGRSRTNMMAINVGPMNRPRKPKAKKLPNTPSMVSDMGM